LILGVPATILNRRSVQTSSDNSWLAYPAAASTISYTANALNQYSAVGSVTPTYDGNGNLTYDGIFTYAYDAESRLTSIKQGATTIATYLYDAQGRRKSKAVGATTTVYTTDADNREVLENDGTSGQVQQWYAYGSGIDEPLNQMALTSSTRMTFIPDIQGSVMATLDAASGTLTKAAYLPFGENPTNYSGTFRYTSRRIDPETGGSTAQPSGLYYYRARMYSPTWGRFLQADPMGYSTGVNLYTYTDNNPLNQTDPSGKCPWCIGAAIGGIAGGISGGIAGYHATGTWRGMVLGAGGGAVVGAAAGALTPWAVGTVTATAANAGGALAGYVAGAATFTAVNAGAGAAGAAAGDVLDYKFAGGGLADLGTDVRNGAIIGAASGLLEAPFVAAGGGAALGFGAAGDAALSAQTAIFGITGGLATTCSLASGCGPIPQLGNNLNVGNPGASSIFSSGSPATQSPSK
jgi:RHS repeat-associated protein